MLVDFIYQISIISLCQSTGFFSDLGTALGNGLQALEQSLIVVEPKELKFTDYNDNTLCQHKGGNPDFRNYRRISDTVGTQLKERNDMPVDWGSAYDAVISKICVLVNQKHGLPTANSLSGIRLEWENGDRSKSVGGRNEIWSKDAKEICYPINYRSNDCFRNVTVAFNDRGITGLQFSTSKGVKTPFWGVPQSNVFESKGIIGSIIGCIGCGSNSDPKLISGSLSLEGKQGECMTDIDVTAATSYVPKIGNREPFYQDDYLKEITVHWITAEGMVKKRKEDEAKAAKAKAKAKNRK